MNVVYSMKSGRWLSSAATVGAWLAASVLSGAADADPLCSVAPDGGQIRCIDSATSAEFTIDGDIPEDTVLDASYGGLRYHPDNLAPLSLTAHGSIRTEDQFDYPVLITTGGNVSYDGRASEILSEGGSNVALRIRAGDELEIWAGSVTNRGGFAYGIAADAGRIEIHGGKTVVGHSSIGIWAQSNYGDAIIYTGDIDASQFDATGAVAFAKDWGDGYGCGSAIINVNGSVVGDAVGVRTTGCANGEIYVLPNGAVSTNSDGIAIRTELVGTARIEVDGLVSAVDPASLAIDQNAASSTVRVRNGGSVMGRYDGTGGADAFSIEQGGSWTVFGVNDFGNGTDLLENGGNLTIGASTQFLGLESLTNSGRIFLSNNELSLPEARLGNTGTILVDGISVLRSAIVENGGTIDLLNGNADGRLTIDGDLAGLTGSTLALDIGPGQADLFTVTGAVTGSTVVNFNILPGTPKLLRSVMFADAANGDSESFVFGSAVGATSPLMAYHIDRMAEGYYLSSSLSDRAAIPISIGALERTAWLQSSVRPADADASEFRGDWSIWASTSGTSYVQGNIVPLTSAGHVLYFQSRQTISQGGLQFGARKKIGENGWHLAASAGYAVGRGKYETRYDDNQARSFNLSALVGFRPIGPGAYGTLQIGRQSLKARFRDESFAQIDGKPKIGSTGARVELGYRDAFRDLGIDLNAAVSVRRLSATHFEADGIQFSIPRQSAWTARAGAHVSFGGNLNPFVGIAANVEGGSRNAVRASLEGVTDTFSSSRKGKWLGIVGGLSPAIANGFSLTVGADLGDYRGGNLAVTYRY